MQARAWMPGVISFSAAISASEKDGHWQRVAPKLDEMQWGAWLLLWSASTQPSQLARSAGSGSTWRRCWMSCRPVKLI
eukprot:8389680-Karenia_brevis.AAC.1